MLLQVWSKRETLQGKSTSKGDGEPSCTTIDSVSRPAHKHFST